MLKPWSDAWAGMVPFLSCDVEIRKVICSTNAVESVNARIRKAVRARGHVPNGAAALKCAYMALTSLNPTGKGSAPPDHALEGTTERLPDRLRRTPHPHHQPLTLTNQDQPLTGHTPGSTYFWSGRDMRCGGC